MNRQVPWVRIVAEGFVIVVSILLAFGVDAWWSGIEMRREARQELVSVMEELVEAQAEIERVALWQGRSLSATIALRSLIDAVPLGEIAIVPDTLLAAVNLFHVSDAPTATVEAFLSSGQIGRLDNADLRRGLISWTSFVTDLHDDEVRTRAALDELISLLSQRVDMASSHDTGTAMLAAGPNAPAPSDAQDVSVPVDLAIRNALARQVKMFRFAVRQSGDMIARSAKLHSLVLAELN